MELAQRHATLATDAPDDDLLNLRRAIERAKASAPRDPAPWVLLAQVLDVQSQAAAARGDAVGSSRLAGESLVEIDGALERYPVQPKLRWLRARLLERLGRGSEAVAEYNLALDYAERTSEKELWFTPAELREIRLAIRRIENPAP
jgi:hypothetical protein